MKARYGASPLHLLAHLAAFALVGWAMLQLVDIGRFDNVVLWLVGAVLLHDALLWPVYAALDQAARRTAPSALVNYLRVPVALSALLALVYLPALLGLNEANQARVGAYGSQGALGRWLLATGVLCAISLAVWVVKGRHAGARPLPGL